MSDDLSQDLLLEETALTPAAPLEFMPWHKPRKQFVRERQWMIEAERLIKKLKVQDLINNSSKPFRYLTLPGIDMLDVKMLAALCKSNGVSLHYTGFCDAVADEASRLTRNISAVRNADLVADGSNVHNYKLEEISNPNSPAYQAFRQGGPYHLVNIDACTPIANERALKSGSSIVNALNALLEYQVGMNMEWLLLLTAVMAKDELPVKATTAMKEVIVQNCKDKHFMDKFQGPAPEKITAKDLVDHRFSTSKIEFIQTATLGLSKWLIHLAETLDMKVVKRPAFCYSKLPILTADKEYNNGSHDFAPRPNMISVCYEIFPQKKRAHDVTGMVVSKNIDAIGTEHHIKAIERSYTMKDLDALTVENPELYKSLVGSTATLLREAGYGENTNERYKSWIQENDAVYPFIQVDETEV